jgi:hypothetical protein
VNDKERILNLLSKENRPLSVQEVSDKLNLGIWVIRDIIWRLTDNLEIEITPDWKIKRV